MDHFSFIISLLLIVSVASTTFGSAIKARNLKGEELQELPKTKEFEAFLADAGFTNFPERIPNRQEREQFLKRSHNTEEQLQEPKDLEEQNSEEKSKRKIGVGTVIEGAELTINLLKDVLNVLANVKRKCPIGVDNESGLGWEQGSTYFFSGTADENLPYSVDNTRAVLYGPRKTSGPVATGAVGVLAYYIPSIDETLSVMFSVPFDYNLYGNWWNAKLYPGNQRANYNQYYDLYYDANPFRANGWHERSLGRGLKFRGSMSNSGQVTLEIHVLKN